MSKASGPARVLPYGDRRGAGAVDPNTQAAALIFPYVCRQGEITLACLTHINGQYRMFVAPAKFVESPLSLLQETCSAWPRGFVRMGVALEAFIDSYHTNHAHVVPGRHLEALEMFCEMLDIPVDRAG